MRRALRQCVRMAPRIKNNARPDRRHRETLPSSANKALARILSKRGICSRTQAEKLIVEGRIRVDGRDVFDPEAPTAPEARIEIDGKTVGAQEKRYLMLNKPRGYITTASDERGRDTVYTLLNDGESAHGWLAPVGRLDKASEGLLLFTNDSEWAARLTDPSSHVQKTYHVQIDALLDAAALARIQDGVDDGDERLAAQAVRELRRGEKNSWLEIVLDEGRNRQIRRLLAAFDIGVLRLIRVAIGSLQLGDLPKGQWRILESREVESLSDRVTR